MTPQELIDKLTAIIKEHPGLANKKQGVWIGLDDYPSEIRGVVVNASYVSYYPGADPYIQLGMEE
jgi:hypothetical protein